MSVPIESPPPAPSFRERALAVWPAIERFGAAVVDYSRRIWVSSGEDNIFFLAGGIAFNLLLAAVPFVLLAITGLTLLLHLSPDASFKEVLALVDRFLPPHVESPDAPVHRLISDIMAARGAITMYAALGYVWFSTRLFGSLRTVLADIFDIETERGIVAGKLFDIKITIYSTILFVGYTFLSVYLAVASSRGLNLLMAMGLRDDVMGWLEYAVGRVLAFGVVVLIFFSLYKYLPNRRIRWRQAFVGAMTSALLLEFARNAWSMYTRSFDPGSVYTGTLYALVSIVFWVYYAALIFVIGGEVAQAQQLRRVRRLQKAQFGHKAAAR
jgi:membrane protein